MLPGVGQAATPCDQIELEYYRLKSSLALQRLSLFYLGAKEAGDRSLEQVLVRTLEGTTDDPDLIEIRKRFTDNKLSYEDRMRLLLKSKNEILRMRARAVEKHPEYEPYLITEEDFKLIEQVADLAKTKGYDRGGGVTDFVSMVTASFHRDDQGRWKPIPDEKAQSRFGHTRVTKLNADFLAIEARRERDCGQAKTKAPAITTDALSKLDTHLSFVEGRYACDDCGTRKSGTDISENVDNALLDVVAKGELMLAVKKPAFATRAVFRWSCGPNRPGCRADAERYYSVMREEIKNNPKLKALLAKHEATVELTYEQPNFKVSIGPLADIKVGEEVWKEIRAMYEAEVTQAVAASVSENFEVMEEFKKTYYKRVHPEATIISFCGGKEANWAKCRYLQSVLRCAGGVGLDLNAKKHSTDDRAFFLNELICHGGGMGIVD